MDRNVLLAVAAAQEAWDDAGLDDVDPSRVGILVGSAIGGIATIAEQQQVFAERGPDRVSPFFIPSVLVDTASGQIAIQLGLKGQNFAPVSACATGSTAIGEAAASIRRGQADVVLAGGTEAPIIPLILAGFCAMRGSSPRRRTPPSRPGRSTRRERGSSWGRGVHPRAGGARGGACPWGDVYAEVLGYGASNDAHHLAQPEPEATGVAADDRRRARRRRSRPGAGRLRQRTRDVDAARRLAETRALKQVFGDHAYRLAVSSTKSVTGHCFGSAGAVEADDVRARAARRRAPPTINYRNPTPSATSTMSRTRRAASRSTSRSRTPWASAATTPARHRRVDADPQASRPRRQVRGPSRQGDGFRASLPDRRRQRPE